MNDVITQRGDIRVEPFNGIVGGGKFRRRKHGKGWSVARNIGGDRWQIIAIYSDRDEADRRALAEL